MSRNAQQSESARVAPKSPEQAAKEARAFLSSLLVTAAVTAVTLWGSFALLG